MKEFNELVKLDISKHTQKKPVFFKDPSTGKLKPLPEEKWLDYIEWAKVLELLYENGAKSVSFYSEIHKEKINTLVIRLLIDSIEYTTDYPIIDGNSVISQPNQMQLHKAELRGFVKCVAIHTGLGLGLWMKEERQLSDIVETPTKLATKPKPQFTQANFEKAFAANASIDKIKQVYDITPEVEKAWIEFVFQKSESNATN